MIQPKTCPTFPRPSRPLRAGKPVAVPASPDCRFTAGLSLLCRRAKSALHANSNQNLRTQEGALA